jgi:hypothetical protein
MQVHRVRLPLRGKGPSGLVFPVCSCGWSGEGIYNSDVNQHIKLREAFEAHLRSQRVRPEWRPKARKSQEQQGMFEL